VWGAEASSSSNSAGGRIRATELVVYAGVGDVLRELWRLVAIGPCRRVGGGWGRGLATATGFSGSTSGSSQADGGGCAGPAGCLATVMERTGGSSGEDIVSTTQMEKRGSASSARF
jgi:hypothetical protein